ncbi:MAG: serine hydrolase domain-containing protein [Pseudomonadota bacterium]
MKTTPRSTSQRRATDGARTSAPRLTLWRKLVGASLLVLLASCGGGGHNAPLPSVSSSANSAQPDNAAIDSYVQSELKRQSIPGLALVVQQNGKLVYAKGYGYANLEQGSAASTEQRFQIGSISKQFAAGAAMLLVEEGKMALDDRISKFIGPVPAQWEAITVRHILTHTSGLPTDVDDAVYSQAARRGAYSSDEILAILKTSKPLTEAGKVFAYSNVGYEVMGIIVEKVSGAFFGDFLQTRIFAPLGMSSARAISANGAGSARGYVVQGGKITPLAMEAISAGELSWYRTGAGGIEMSANDLAKWDASLATEKVLKKSSIDQMWAPGVLVEAGAGYTIHYGFGWFSSDYLGHPKVYHSGGMASFTTDYVHYTKDQLSVIVLTNLGSAWSDPQPIARSVANMYVPGILPPQ